MDEDVMSPEFNASAVTLRHSTSSISENDVSIVTVGYEDGSSVSLLDVREDFCTGVDKSGWYASKFVVPPKIEVYLRSMLWCLQKRSEEKTSPQASVDANTLEELKASGCLGEVCMVADLAKECYEGLRGIHVAFKNDPEIQARRILRIQLKVCGNTEKILNSERMFKRRIRHTVNASLREQIAVLYEWNC